jgi:acetyl esterase/lipase
MMNMKLLLWIGIGIFCLITAANAQNNRRNNPSDKTVLNRMPEGVVATLNVAYREGNERWTLDLFYPENIQATSPAIVFIHGGGWRSGNKRKWGILNAAMTFAKKGYVTATLNYRLIQKKENPAIGIQNGIEDVKCAVRWLRANAEKYNIDPKRIGGYGNSAGAHLVSMLGLCPPSAGLEGDGPYQEYSSNIQAVVASATPTDFNLFELNEQQRQNELTKKLSPITYVHKNAPPFLLFHDSADKIVDIRHSEDFTTALKKAKAKDVTFKSYNNGSGHGVFYKNARETVPLREEFFDLILGK